MIIKCENCNGALKYDAAICKMKCEYCDAVFEADDVSVEVTKEDTMECNVVSCTSCGAELMINGVESATFCAYCGQPTIVFSRVSKMLKPQKIIPFSVTRQQAVEAIRKRFRKGFFVPSEIKSFEVERVTRIYIPYWLYDVTYYDAQVLRGKSGKHYQTHKRTARSHFKNVTIDASSNLIDESSQRLEPYNMEKLQGFEEGYLSGYYADRYDQTSEALSKVAIQSCKELFDKEVVKSVPASNVSVKTSNPKTKVRSKVYAMLPAWFMTFRYQDKPYTMMVNGQTGKVVGAVPIQKAKVVAVFIVLFCILAPIFAMISANLFEHVWNSEDGFGALFKLVCGYIFVGFCAYAVGNGTWMEVRKNILRTSSQSMKKFAGDRQEGDE